MSESIQMFMFQLTIITLMVNALVNVFKPLWQSKPWQSTADLYFGLAVSALLCTLFRVDGITLLLQIAFPSVPAFPWWIGTVITGLLGEKLAAILNDMLKSFGFSRNI